MGHPAMNDQKVRNDFIQNLLWFLTGKQVRDLFIKAPRQLQICADTQQLCSAACFRASPCSLPPADGGFTFIFARNPGVDVYMPRRGLESGFWLVSDINLTLICVRFLLYFFIFFAFP